MNAVQVIKNALASTQQMTNWYLSDLSDADFLLRPVPNANHIAWQMGHLIHAEVGLQKGVSGATLPELPAGWSERHSKETASIDPPKGFATKEEYISLFNKVREASIANVSKLTDADLDKANTGSLKEHAPTIGSLFMLISNHTLMHAGQFTVVRRKLGKKVLF